MSPVSPTSRSLFVALSMAPRRWKAGLASDVATANRYSAAQLSQVRIPKSRLTRPVMAESGEPCPSDALGSLKDRSGRQSLPRISRKSFLLTLSLVLIFIALLSGNGTPGRAFGPMPPANYAGRSVQLGANTTILLNAAQTDTTSINVSTSTNFKRLLEGSPTTGIVRLTDAHPAATYSATVTNLNFTLASHASMATLTVTNTNDSGAGSLRQAILDANATPGLDMISFNIGAGGLQTITPASPLPDINDAVVIDGTTQPGFVGTPVIELNGANAGASQGLSLLADGSTVRGLIINRFQFAGIFLNSVSTNVIEGNYIGTNAAGTAALGNAGLGIHLFAGSSDNVIGGTLPNTRNVISGNGAGIQIDGGTGNVVQGNFIGTDASGTVAVGNANGGINIGDSANNVIGGLTAAARNIISGNTGVAVNGTGHGVSIGGVSSIGNLVQGNYIGVDVNGINAIPNVRSGVFISSGATGNTVGGVTSAARNVISGNSVPALNGNIDLSGVDIQTSGNTVSHNYIGTNAAGTSAIANGSGVVISGSNNQVLDNLLSGNKTTGIFIFNFQSGTPANNVVQGNFVGTNSAGTAALRQPRPRRPYRRRN